MPLDRNRKVFLVLAAELSGTSVARKREQQAISLLQRSLTGRSTCRHPQSAGRRTDKIQCGRAGDKIVVPARTLHAEGAVKDGVAYILALSAPLLPDEFLAMRDPEELRT